MEKRRKRISRKLYPVNTRAEHNHEWIQPWGRFSSVEIVQPRLRIPVNRITGERERVKGRGHPSSHHLFALIAGHICSEPGLCSPLLGGIAWKSSVFPRPTLSTLVSPPPPSPTKSPNNVSLLRSFSVLERRIDRLSALLKPWPEEPDIRWGKRRMERKRIFGERERERCEGVASMKLALYRRIFVETASREKIEHPHCQWKRSRRQVVRVQKDQGHLMVQGWQKG